MLTLAIDTSSKTESVAILNERDVIFEQSQLVMTNHAASLLVSIKQSLSAAGTRIEDIDLFALTVGPGSFTGLRIAASTIKGLALATGKPVVGVQTLEALAFNVAPSDKTICPFMDAKRNEVYTALYTITADGIPREMLSSRVTSPDLFLRSLHGEVLFLGDGIQKYSRLIEELLWEKPFFAPPHSHFVRSSAVGLLGIHHYSKGLILDTLTFTPGYLRLPQAEMKINHNKYDNRE